MKSFFRLCLPAIVGCTILSCSQGPTGEFNIELYSQNDIHGSYFDSLYVEDGERPYSLVNISEYVNGRRAAVGAENIILIDNGDHLQGDNAAYYANFIDTLKGANDTTKHLFSRIMNYMGVDAVIVGNHDIEAGHPVYDRVAKELNAPYLAANAVKEGTTEPYFEPYTILFKNGIKVAVIGMTNANMKAWLQRALWDGMDFLEIEDVAKRYIDEVKKKENPQVIVLAMHSGVGEYDKSSKENPARYLASKLPVDIVLASHDHQSVCEKVWNGKDSVLILDASSRSELLAFADIKLKLDNGKVLSKKIDGKLIKMAGTPKDSLYMKTFREDFLKVREFTNQNVGNLKRDMITSDAFFGPSDYMNMIHYVQMASTGADISFAAPLTYNKTVKQGNININDMFTIYPYENQLYLINLTGTQIKNYLELAYDNWINTVENKNDNVLKIEKNPKNGKYRFKNMTFNFDSGAGLDYTVDVTKPFGQRINITSVTGKDSKNKIAFQPDYVYKVALSSYRGNGGGDLLVKGAGIASDSLESIIIERFPEIRDLIYVNFKNGNLDSIPDYNNWQFIPQELTGNKLKQERALMF